MPMSSLKGDETMANYNEMTMVELKAELVKKRKEYNAASKVCEPLYKSYVEDMTKYMTKLVKGMDVKVDVEIDRINLRCDAKYELTLHLEKEYPNGYDAPYVQKIEMSPWSCRVHNGDTSTVNYYVLIGMVAPKLDDILVKMTNSKVREELLQAQRKVHEIHWEIEKIEREIDTIERNAKKEDAMKSIKVGAVLVINKRRGYKATITRMGKKCVFLNDGGWKDVRYAIDGVADQIAHGFWEIVK